jgi:C4-dicarboxylate-specific signal transduction histidine kinase
VPPLHEVVRDVLLALETRIQSQGVCVTVDVSPHVVMQPVTALRPALFQLVSNALDNMPTGGDLAVTSFEDQHCVEVEVADSGQGIDHLVRRLLRRPPYEGAPLWAARRFAAEQGGELRAANCSQGGAALTLSVPRATSRAAA